ncbi:MAG: Ig-like domain-containing protein, partial [Flammeovirgaceae bacterium]|nr:Ig-like domain-containing protein [Flammeovirgaceae bacterium]MDW8287883.1 Ig-like domain-containing protein [Flammeovirgaceae bacterium]
MKNYYRFFLYNFISLLFFFALNRCANVQPPQGGAKDTIPPILVGSIPSNGALNVKENVVTLFFNEDIVLENLSKELVIAPNEGNSFRHILKRNKLILRFEKPFRDSTTYTLDFRNTVRDFSEKNPAKNLRLAFSTWNILDTLFIKGEVRHLFTGKPINDAIVALYTDGDTLSITKDAPLYFAKTNEN